VTTTDVVPAALAGERVDRVVAVMTDLSRSEVRRLVEAGAVSVDELVVSVASTRVAEGATVEVALPATTHVDSAPQANSAIEFPVVFIDDDVIVVDKPIGVVVHPGAGGESDTLVNGLLARWPELSEVGEPDRPGIVHRLDRDTSGLLVVARHEQARADLVAQLSTHTVRRVYLTLVRGVPDAATGVIDAPIGRSRRSRTRMTVSEDGRPARTHYELVEPFAQPFEAALLRCRLETGRTHQIRVHLNAVGLHVLGDRTYGRPDPFGIGRQLLHAAELAFEHPRTGETVSFTSRLPADMAGAVERFRAATESAREQLGPGQDG